MSIRKHNDTNIIAVDLDGTLAEYHGWGNVYEIGKPIPKMVNRVKKWLKQGKRIVIFTARITEGPWDDDNFNKEKTINTIQDWCEKNIGKRLEVTNIKSPEMIEFWDDRARQIIFNKGILVKEKK